MVFRANDQPRSATCKQIALAIREEVLDLEKAGMRMIQIDQPALREGLPFRKADSEKYLESAVDCFRMTASGVEENADPHAHVLLEFNDIMPPSRRSMPM